MSLNYAWLQCTISEGILPNEFTVECSSADRVVFSFFAPEELIDSSRTKVKVKILDSDNNHYLVFLPVLPFENINRTVKVDKNVVSL